MPASSWRATLPERVRYLQARGRGSASRERVARGRTARGSPIKRYGLPDLGAHDRESWVRSVAPADVAIWASSVLRRLELGVWLIHPRSGYAAMNFSSENTVSRDRI